MTREQKLDAALYCLSLRSMGDLTHRIERLIELNKMEEYYLIENKICTDEDQVAIVQKRARQIICELLEKAL